MTMFPVLLSLFLVDLPAAEIETLKGDVQRGQLQSLTAEGATLKVGDQQVQVPADGVLELRLTASPANVAVQPTIVVSLADDSRLLCSQYSVANGLAKLVGPNGEVSVPIAAIANVRFTLQTEVQTAAWQAMLEKTGRNDSVVIVTKEGSLDRLNGVIGNVGDKVQFLLDGDELQVAREKLHGIIYRKREPVKSSGLGVQLTGEDRLSAKTVSFDGQAFQVALSAGGQMVIPIDRLRSIDYSAGKVRYLSQDAPRDIDAKVVWGGFKIGPDRINDYFRRNLTRGGTKIKLNDKVYERGLSMYPDTTVRYRIGGDYTRFKAVLGVDDSYKEITDAHVKITDGDGNVLHESDVKDGDDPRELDLDVTNVRDLILSVTHGRDKLSTGDFIVFGDARVLK